MLSFKNKDIHYKVPLRIQSQELYGQAIKAKKKKKKQEGLFTINKFLHSKETVNKVKRQQPME